MLRAILGMLGIGRDLSTMSREERTLEAYYDRLNVYAVEKSRVIAIDFSSANPDLAAQVANTIAETYLSTQQAAKQDQTRAAGNWLAGEIEKMRTRVADAEAKVEEYRSRANLFVRLQQYVAAEPAAYRDQFADCGGARTEGRPGGEGAPIARPDEFRASRSTPPISPIPTRCAA